MPTQAVRVLREAGVNITGQASKLVSTLTDVPWDLVITVCSHADEHCPAVLRQARVVQVGFDDHPKLAKAAANERSRTATRPAGSR